MIRLEPLHYSPEFLAKSCRRRDFDDAWCPVGMGSCIPCPFPNKDCSEITPDDWERLDDGYDE